MKQVSEKPLNVIQHKYIDTYANLLYKLATIKGDNLEKKALGYHRK